jgi:eukaryotic-like serine/threonine-protein kinase
MKFRIPTNTLKALLVHLSLALMLFCLLSFTLFYKVLPWVTNKDNIVTVPDLQQMSIDEAMRFVSNRDLKIEVTDSLYNAALPALTVLEQFPRPDTFVKINRKISVKLNARNPPKVPYLDLLGSSFEFAQKQLKSLDLKIGTIQYRTDIAHNAILESRINGRKLSAGDPVTKGSRIDLVIGTLPDRFVIPSLKDIPFDEAEAYIHGMKLKIKKINYFNMGAGENNTVQKQLPAPGDTVKHNDEVELWILKRDN